MQKSNYEIFVFVHLLIYIMLIVLIKIVPRHCVASAIMGNCNNNKT